MDADYIAQELRKIQMYDFYCNIFRTLKVWFEAAQPDQSTGIITQRIFLSGAYGSNASRSVFEAVRDKVQTGASVKQIQRKSWINVVFLPYSNMCVMYPVLEKVPILLPFMWVARWLRVLFTRPQAIAKHRNKVKQLDAQKLDTWEAQMNAVGLTFDFEE